jgi:plasmid maintenance system antidote protein VapI
VPAIDTAGPPLRAGRNAGASASVVNDANPDRDFTGDTALRLAHFFGTSAEFWLNLQKLPTLKRVEDALA